MGKILDVARGVAVGAALMYLADPQRGRRRRARLRDRARHLGHKATDGAGKAARDARNRTLGAIAEARGRLGDDDADDRVIEARVRAAIGRAVAHPHAIRVRSNNAVIHLSGPLLVSEVDALLSTVANVRGVRSVEHGLDTFESADHVPALQGGPENTGRGRTYWSPAMRALGGVAGGALVVGSRRLPGPLRTAARAAGAGLALRAATNLDRDELLGVNGAHHVVNVHKSIRVAAPVADVFGFWSHFENFPRFMSHLEEVRRVDELTSHWTAAGPLGRRFEWDAEITEFHENALISWRSLPGGDVDHGGTVRFYESEDGGTRINVSMRYEPIGGAIGHGLAALFGLDPKSAMDDDLVRFKSLIESGKATAHGHTVSRAEIAAENEVVAPAP